MPTTVAHYRLLDSLGEGGMGVVYRAHDLRLDREVAVKLLRTDAGLSPEWRARFEREARLASSLQHPHICTIHELGEDGGHPYIAMERLEGQTLRQLIHAGPLPVARVLHLARQTADALDAAHRRGIIHRDIKPANLFVTHGDHIKVLDFGLAKSASPTALAATDSSTTAAAMRPAPAAQDLTVAGVAVGTAAYMSPEQAQGLALDARSDLFSLGSVLYECATGRRAFGGDDVALIGLRIVNGILVPPRTIEPAIPESVERIIRKLLALSPADRYQSAAALLDDLNAAIEAFEQGSTAPTAPPAAPRRWRALWLAGAAALAMALLAAVSRVTWLTPRPALSDRDRILVAAFENTTGEQVFENTLITALKVQLAQSPFLDIVPDQRTAETLRLMGRRDEPRLTPALAREVCQRLGLKAMLEGSIASLGSTYVLRLVATDCQTGEPLALDQGEARGQSAVLSELGRMSLRMRSTLGESLPSMRRFDLPIEQATTPSLTALRAYALGLEERRRGREFESVAFFNQAIEIDPEFASAYAVLSTVYGSLGEWRRSEEYARKAYDRRGRVSERERMLIAYQYHDRATNDEEEAAATLEVWKGTYPRDVRPANALALIHNRMGRYALAEREAQEALRRSPGHPFPISNLAVTYRALGRYPEARRVANEAVALGTETTPTRRLLYQLAVMAGDGSAQQHLAWAKGRPREFDLVSAQAQVAAYEGRLREAGELYRRAYDMAVARGLKGAASGLLAHMAWTDALYREPHDAGARVAHVLAAAPGDTEAPDMAMRFRAAAALALTGRAESAVALANRAEKTYPRGTFAHTVLGPVTRAAIALHERRADAALAALAQASPTELGIVAGLVPLYLRGEALRQAGAYPEAIAEYARVLQHRGVDPFAPIIPLAQLGTARAHAGAGNGAEARRAYERLFETWKAADTDFPPLLAARAEHARLGSAGTSRP